MPHQSLFPTVEIPDVDNWELIFEREKPFPDSHEIFIDSVTKRSYTYGALKSTAIAFGKGLVSRWQWRKGDVLAFFTPNCVDMPPAIWGVHWAGGVVSTANPTYTVEELAFQLQDCGARAVATLKPLLPVAREAARKVGMPEDRIVLIGDERDEGPGADGKQGAPHFSDLFGEVGGQTVERVRVDPKTDLCFLVYSSGTTGRPKGVMLTHYNVVANISQSQFHDMAYVHWKRDVQLAILPFFHIYGLQIVVQWAAILGLRTVVLSKFDLQTCCALIEAHRVSVLYVPPPVVLGLAKHPLVGNYDLTSLKIINSAAAPLTRELVDGVWDRLRVGVKQGYGMSEMSPVTHAQEIHEWGRFIGAVGKLLPNMEARIVDEAGKEVADGQSGEILLRGPNVFRGYHNLPHLDGENLTADGFYKTGDIGYIDKHGNFYITDRLKELIKFNGFQVAPAELEGLLLKRDDIADVCVVGVWDDNRQTEVPRAYVVLAKGQPTDGDASAAATRISEWLTSQVAPHKRLRGGIRFLDAVPKSPAGKILRRVLREQAKEDDATVLAKL